MKLTDNKILELEYNQIKKKWYKRKNGKITQTFILKNSCKNCGDPFLANIQVKGLYCNIFCQNSGKNNPMYGKKRPDITGNKNYNKRPEVRKRRSEMMKGDKNPSKRLDVKKKLSLKLSGKNNPSYNGGYAKKNIPAYNVYKDKIGYFEPVKRNQEDPNILEVKCTWCGKWFIPTLSKVWNRIQSTEGKMSGECRFYCSDGCRHNCPIWNKSPEQLIKEDAVKIGRLPWLELNREVQPELRKMVFKRDGYKCIKCRSNESLHCHHVEGIRWNPLESADIDACITVCSDCHKEIHKKDGCGYNDMKCKIERIE